MVLRLTRRDRRAFAMVIAPRRVRLDRVRFSEAEADRIQDRLFQVLIRNRVRPAMVSFDLESQRFLVEAKKLSGRVRKQLARIAPPRALRYSVGPMFDMEPAVAR